MARNDRGRHLRHRIRADLSRPAADIGIACRGVSLYDAVLRRARLLCLSRRTAARTAMGRAGPELRRRRARHRCPAGQCRRQRPDGRSVDRRRRRAVGGHDADRQGDRADQGARRKGPRPSGRGVDTDSGLCGVDIGRNHQPCSRAAVAVTAGLSVVLGGGPDVHVVVRAGEDLFGQQIVGLHLHHAAVRRGGRLLHPARQADGDLRRRGAIGDRRALSRQQARNGAGANREISNPSRSATMHPWPIRPSSRHRA